MIIYYCRCGEKVEGEKTDMLKCKCGKPFSNGYSTSNYINMRKTLSGTTKMEFSTTTMDESIAKMNGEK